MVLNVLKLAFEGYRNLETGEIRPEDGMNIIFGKNAQGKTNLLEAIWLFTGGRSFRGAKDSELVTFGKENAQLSLHFFSEEREQSAALSLREGRRFAVLNGVEKKSVAGLVGVFCAVVFSPEHLSLIKAGPAGRRAFLDAAICQTKPSYAVAFSRYQQTLSQRNALLKDIPRHAELMETLEIWDDKLAHYGEAVREARGAYVKELLEPAGEVYAGISSGGEQFGMKYACGEELREALKKTRRSDVQYGHTTEGPHRDDLEITLNGISARCFGSQGQQRSLVLALKLAEADVLEKKTGERPVVLLDDVMSELDAGRQDYLLNHLKNRQVFITCCEPETVSRLRGGARYQVKEGIVGVSASGAGHGSADG